MNMIRMSRESALFWWKKELPKNVLYLYQDDSATRWPGVPEPKWKAFTREDLNAEKKQKQENNIDKKRYFYRKVSCYIHVFKVNTNFLFHGFYCTIWSNYGEWYLNWKTDYKHEDFLERIMRHLDLGILPMLDEDIWFEAFCKAYPMKPRGIQYPRGKYLTHCTIDNYNNLIDIDFPKTKQQQEEIE